MPKICTILVAVIIVCWVSVSHGEERVEPRLTLCGHESYVDDVAFSPDGTTLASASVNIRLWDAATGAAKATFEEHLGGVNMIAFTPDGKALLSASGGGSVKLWDLTGKDDHKTVLLNPGGSVIFALSPDGATLAVNYDKFYAERTDARLFLRDLAAGGNKVVLEHDSAATTWVFSPGGKTLAAGYPDGVIKFWDVASRKVRDTIRPWPEADGIAEIAFSPDGQLLAIKADAPTVPANSPVIRQLKVWDVGTMREHATMKGVSGWPVSHPAFSPDGRLLATADGRDVTLWETATAKVTAVLKADTLRHVSCVAFSPDGKSLAAGTTYTIRPLKDAKVLVWDVPEERAEPNSK